MYAQSLRQNSPVILECSGSPPLLRLQALPSNCIPSLPASFPEAQFCRGAGRVCASPARRLLAGALRPFSFCDSLKDMD